MCRIVVHIGLPKTATTSLQRAVFPHTDEFTVYCGKHYSEASRHPIYMAMAEYIHGTGDIACARRTLADVMGELVAQGIDKIVLSDEMLCIDTVESNWQEKLVRCASFLDGHDYRLIVVLRNPLEAAYSLFVELGGQDILSMTFRDFCVSSNQSRIYDYGVLSEHLVKNFCEERIVFSSYEYVIGETALTENYSGLGIEFYPKRIIEDSNTKSKNEAGYMSNVESWKIFVKRYPILRLIGGKISIGRRKKIKNLLNALIPRKVQLIPFPTGDELAYLRKYYSASERTAYEILGGKKVDE